MLIAIVILGIRFLSPDWQLMMCNEIMTDGSCKENSHIVSGYKSQKECLEAGISLDKGKNGFECGQNCKNDEYGLFVCKKICTSSGYCHN
jgi:hypothetical protein